jgi:ParB family chromosome partitioning protein
MQPVLVREEAGGRYELIAGERRWRAARIAGLATVPAVVKNLDAKTSAEWALVENLQREDLNPLERADAFQKLINEFGLTHEEVAVHVGVDRTNVTNHLRLLRLHPDIQSWLSNELLSMGHARALAGLDQQDVQIQLARRSIENGWSVRQLETAVKAYLSAGQAQSAKLPASSMPKARSAVILDMEKQLSEALGTRVAIRTGRKKGSGVLSIEYHSLDDFDHLVGRLGVTLH